VETVGLPGWLLLFLGNGFVRRFRGFGPLGCDGNCRGISEGSSSADRGRIIVFRTLHFASGEERARLMLFERGWRSAEKYVGPGSGVRGSHRH